MTSKARGCTGSVTHNSSTQSSAAHDATGMLTIASIDMVL
jgi:hypothetical protein